jgi:tetratricopeptide (TPR) repeat protein
VPPSLLPIIAHARAGALDHALRLFQDAGLDAVTDDAAVLSLKGRLLKDQGRRATGEQRRAFYARSAEAYGAAGAMNWATYPLINAASLSLLAGEPERAAALAQKVLDRLDRGDAEPDTPWWREATRAEAELLLGRTHEAWVTLQGAVALAPRAWEDHASTLRQFALILEAQGAPAEWLEPLRPPRSLHFAGHLGIDPDDADLAARVSRLLEAENVGFGYGALAAGADIVIAEALLARGAALCLVLPASRAAFRTASVETFGEAWGRRFDAVLARAETVAVIPGLADRPDPLSLKLAGRAAMGRAAMQARLLASEAIQLTIPPPRFQAEGEEAEDDAPSLTTWARETWTRAGRRALTLDAPRNRPPPPGAALTTPPDALIAAVLALAPPEGQAETCAPAILAALDEAGAAPLRPPVWTGQALLLVFETCEQALAAARLSAPALGAGRTAGAAGIARQSGLLLMGAPLQTAARLLASVPPGAALVDAVFAGLLAAGPEGEAVPCEPVGELPPLGADDLAGDIDPGVYSLNL